MATLGSEHMTITVDTQPLHDALDRAAKAIEDAIDELSEANCQACYRQPAVTTREAQAVVATLHTPQGAEKLTATYDIGLCAGCAQRWDAHLAAVTDAR